MASSFAGGKAGIGGGEGVGALVTGGRGAGVLGDGSTDSFLVGGGDTSSFAGGKAGIGRGEGVGALVTGGRGAGVLGDGSTDSFFTGGGCGGGGEKTAFKLAHPATLTAMRRMQPVSSRVRTRRFLSSDPTFILAEGPPYSADGRTLMVLPGLSRITRQ